MECYKHPEATAEASCVICQEPICVSCRTWHAGYATCHMCAAREQLREARAAMNGADAPKSAAVDAATPLLACGFMSSAKALLLATAAAMIGAVLWSRIALWTGWPLGLLAVALGWSAGAAVRAACGGHPGAVLRWLTLLVTALGVMLGHGLSQMGQTYRLHPELASDAAGVPLPLQALLFTLAAPAKLGLLDWLFAYLGIFAAWRAGRPVRRVAGSRASDPPAEDVPALVGSDTSCAKARRPDSCPSASPPMGLPRKDPPRQDVE